MTSTVLVVDDEPALRRTLEDLLDSCGHSVLLAESAEAAMTIIDGDDEERVGVVITDIRLPNASGVDLLGYTRRLRPDIEVVLMSGAPDLETAAAALKLGAHDYLFKPLSIDEVIRVVSEAAARHRQRRSARASAQKQVAHIADLRDAVDARSRELRESAARYQELVENLNIVVFEVDVASRSLTHVSGGLVQRFVDLDWAFPGLDLFALVHPEDREGVASLFAQLAGPEVDIPAPFELRMLGRDGETVYVRCVPSRQRTEVGGFIGGVLIDVTGQRLAEAELENARAILDQKLLRDLSIDDERDSFRVEPPSERLAVSMVFGTSRAMGYVKELATLAGEHDEPVLITGESGTGKGALAAYVHRNSTRADGPFVTVNCASLRGSTLMAELFGYARGAHASSQEARPGLIEEAAGGTLFLDEVGELSLEAQGVLLSVLETRTFQRLGETRARSCDFRLVAATHRDLLFAVQEGTFRGDLLYRVDVVPIALPSLRERAEDIPVLARFLAEATGARVAFAEETLDFLAQQRWPGNVRELRNALVRAVLLARGRTLRVEHIEPFLGRGGYERRASRPPSQAPGLGGDERDRIVDLLARFDGNRAKVARTLGIARSSLYRKLSAYNID